MLGKEFASENEFEESLIDYLTSNNLTSAEHLKGLSQDLALSEVAQHWEYGQDLNTTDKLWQNFKEILEETNAEVLNNEKLSEEEFTQVKREIKKRTQTPFNAGLFLNDLRLSQIPISRKRKSEPGEDKVYLNIFNLREAKDKRVPAGSKKNRYQIVNQAQTKGGEGRFDVTLLINGLPVINIELKKDEMPLGHAYTQQARYGENNQFSDIFSTVQILIAMKPREVKYFANNGTAGFSEDFAFRWKDRSNRTITDWQEFCRSFLSPVMVHQMATDYMILDAKVEKVKVMRPYQVYATQEVIEKIKHHDFTKRVTAETARSQPPNSVEEADNLAHGNLGFIWHTTGSGKTITSFKTAWLALKQEQVKNVVFIVDRISLTDQTYDSYQNFDLNFDKNASEHANASTVLATKDSEDLRNKLATEDKKIVVTSIQKLADLARDDNYQAPDKNLVFIVDEAHRSTAGNQFRDIKTKFKTAAWVGYTGTPIFAGENNTTRDIFGERLHSYTIRDAIADGNVLGFKVDFVQTLDLFKILRNKFPDWTDEQIKQELARNHEQELASDALDESGKGKAASKSKHPESYVAGDYYDSAENIDKHISLVVKDILDNWSIRSCNRQYSAIFTTHLGGKGSSKPLALKYYQAFQQENQQRAKSNPNYKPLNIAISFSSSNTTKNDEEREVQQDFKQAINDYDQTFGTNFAQTEDFEAYFTDLCDRLRDSKKLKNRNDAENPSWFTKQSLLDKDDLPLDLIIVVNQLLTGFDAPHVNTLYVDRTLQAANLIQAYSRTNRICNSADKPFGQIVNYRWPSENKILMDKALAIYGDLNSANLSPEEQEKQNIASGITQAGFEEVFTKFCNCVAKLDELTDHFTDLRDGEEDRQSTHKALQDFTRTLNKLDCYTDVKEIREVIGGEEGEEIDTKEIYQAAGMSAEEFNFVKHSLPGLITDAFKQKSENKEQVIDYIVEKISERRQVIVNHDYITKLLNLFGKLVEEEKAGNTEEVERTAKEIIELNQEMAYSLPEKKVDFDRLNLFTKAIKAGYLSNRGIDYKFESPEDLEFYLNRFTNEQDNLLITQFREKWQISTSPDLIQEVIDFITEHNGQLPNKESSHAYGQIEEEVYKDRTGMEKILRRKDLEKDLQQLWQDLNKFSSHQ